MLKRQNVKDEHQLLNLLWIVAKTLVILFILGGGKKFFHNPIERSIASTEERSSGVLLRNEPL